MATTSATDIVTRKLVSAYNDFGLRLLSQLVTEEADKNVFISSFSVAIALAMTYNGADGMTKQAMAEFDEMEGDIVLPRFKVEYRAILNDALIALGMGVAFHGADFSGMGVGELVISQVIHKTFVEVNAEGTEAAAATVVVMRKSAEPSDRFSMVVDRPFFAAIRDNETGAVLFMGFVLDPTEG